MNLNYKSSAAQRSSLKWGTERLYDTFVDTLAVFLVSMRGQWGEVTLGLQQWISFIAGQTQ